MLTAWLTSTLARSPASPSQPTSRTACHSGGVCSSRAVVPGRGLEAFAARLLRNNRTASGSRVTVKVLGNSVAEWNRYQFARHFVAALGQRFSSISFTLGGNAGGSELGEKARNAGGFGPEHAALCDMGHLHDADVILVLYNFADEGFRTLLEGLYGLPHAPLVLVIEFCAIVAAEMLWEGDAFNLSRSVFLRRDKHKDNPEAMQGYADMMLRSWRTNHAHLAALQSARVDVCAAIHSFLDGSCDGTGGPIRSMTDVGRRLFPEGKVAQKDGAFLGDPLHPTVEQSNLQGCLASRMVIGAAEQQQQQQTATAVDSSGAVASSSSAASAAPAPQQRSWCLMPGQRPFASAIVRHPATHHAEAAAAAPWVEQTGGRGGNKRWIAPTADGARLELSLPATAPRLLVEYYVHDDIPLGAARARVLVGSAGSSGGGGGGGGGGGSGSRREEKAATLWGEPTTLETKCSGCPPHQGVFRLATVAEGLPVNSSLRLWLEVTAVASPLALNFSLVSVIGAW